MNALLIALSVLGYGFFGGISLYAMKNEKVEDEFGLAMTALFWPVTLPALVGFLLIRRLTTPAAPKPKPEYPPPVTSGGYRTDRDGG